MNRAGKISSVLWIDFSQHFFRGKTAVLLILLWFITELFLAPIKRTAYGINELISPAVITYLMSNYTYLLLFMLGVIYFYSEVPFTYRSQLYFVLRQGKKRWIGIQLLYIGLTSPLLAGLAAITAIVQILPVLNTSAGWGRVLGTLALTNAGQQFGVAVNIDYELMVRHSPSEAFFYTMGIGSLVILFIGLLMMAVSMWADRFWAAVSASLFAVLPGAHMMGIPKIDYFSPVSWVRLTNLGYGYRYSTPQLGYILSALAILNSALLLIIIFPLGKQDIKWMEEE